MRSFCVQYGRSLQYAGGVGAVPTRTRSFAIILNLKSKAIIV